MSTLSFDEMFGLDEMPAPKPAAAPSANKPADQLAFFVEKYAPIARAAGERLGVEPELLLGQWGLETGWGRSVISDTHNLGNIKDFSGKGPKARDNMTGSTDSYRRYETPEAFADDFSNLIGGNKRYAGALGAGGDAKRYFAGLKQGGYAEDPAYVAKGTQAVNMARRALANANPTAETPKLPAEPTARSPQTQFAQSPMTDEEMLDIIGVNRMAQPAAPMPERSVWQAGGDLALGVAQGGLGAIKAVSDIAGADNPVSQFLDDGNKALQESKSERAQRVARQGQQRMEDAKGEGTMAEIGAYLDAVWDAPLDMTAQAAGSFLPFLFTGGVAAGARLLGLSNAAKAAGVTKKVFLDSPAGKALAQEIAKNVGTKFTKPVNTAVGVAMGLGGVKGQQYETTLREAKAAGKSDEEAKQLATEAQAYGNSVGGTLQQIGGAALGGVAAATGPLERALSRIPGAAPSSRGIFGRAGVGALKESFPEGGQAFHQAWAGNEAAIDAGVMDPSRRFEGAAGQAIQEAVLAAPMGGAAGAMEPGPVRQNKPAPAPARQPTTPVAPPVAPAASPATPPAPAVGPTASTPTASPLDLGDASIDPAMAKLSDEELQSMMADVEAREEDATDDDWVNYSAAMAELDRRKTQPATPTAPKDEAAKLSSIFDTDTVYQGWSNVRDGSDRADMLAQIDDVAEMYRKSPVLSGYTPEQLDYELKTAYKWYRSAEPAQRQAAVEQILGRKVETPAKPEGSAEQKTSETPASSDPLYGSALEFALGDEAGTTSIAKLQGALRIGYNRAARLIEDMVAAGDLAPNERGGYNVLGEKPKARGNDQEIASAPPEAPSNLFGELPDAEPDAIEQPEAPEYDYYDLSPDDQAAYDAAYAIDDDTRNLIDRYVPADVDDDLIPGFDAAADNPASDEDFLRQMGATDEEIADALSTTQQSPRAQSTDPSPVAAAPDVAASPQAVPERSAQEPQELGTVQQGDGLNNVGLPFTSPKAAKLKAKKDNKGGQVVPVQGGFVVRMPQNMSGTPSATMGTRTDAKAGPGFTAADVVRRDPIAGQKINDEWTAFAQQSGTLGIPRAEMPQVKAQDRGAMVNFLKARGIDSSKEQLPPTALKPTQAEFSPAKVQEAADRTDGDRSIIVSQDGYVVDGHHQWLAQRQKGEPINVIRLDQPITQVLDALKQMPSAQPEQKQDATLTNEGTKPAIDPSTLAAKQRWEQRQAEEKQQAAQNQQENERYNAYVQEQEKDAERRRLQGDNIIQQANGKPFKTETSAQAKLDEFDLADTHAIQKTDKGFVLRRMPPAEQTEQRRKAEGRESYMEAQAAVLAEMGIGETANGEIDATDEQFAEIERRTAERLGRNAQPADSKPNQPPDQQAPAEAATETVADAQSQAEMTQQSLLEVVNYLGGRIAKNGAQSGDLIELAERIDAAYSNQFPQNIYTAVKTAAQAIRYVVSTGRVSMDSASAARKLTGVKAAKALAQIAQKGGLGTVQDHIDAFNGLMAEVPAKPASLKEGSADVQASQQQADTPKLTQAEAKALMDWQDLGQKDGVKTHILTFYATQADKDAKRGRMTLATISKGDVSANAWTVDGDDQRFASLSAAKKRAGEIGMARAVSDGYVQPDPNPGTDATPAPLPESDRPADSAEFIQLEKIFDGLERRGRPKTDAKQAAESHPQASLIEQVQDQFHDLLLDLMERQKALEVNGYRIETEDNKSCL